MLPIPMVDPSTDVLLGGGLMDVVMNGDELLSPVVGTLGDAMGLGPALALGPAGVVLRLL